MSDIKAVLSSIGDRADDLRRSLAAFDGERLHRWGASLSQYQQLSQQQDSLAQLRRQRTTQDGELQKHQKELQSSHQQDVDQQLHYTGGASGWCRYWSVPLFDEYLRFLPVLDVVWYTCLRLYQRRDHSNVSM